jgi:hypothetical protein
MGALYSFMFYYGLKGLAPLVGLKRIDIFG